MMNMDRQRQGRLIVGVLALSGAGLLWKGLEASSDVQPVTVESSPSSPASGAAGQLAPVSPGTGVYRKAGPEETDSVAGSAACAGCDVVLITVCSLRKDHLGTYGHPGALSPSIDAIAQQGVRFERAYAASNFTLASLTGILTGRYGSATGVTGWDKGLTTDVPTLP